MIYFDALSEWITSERTWVTFRQNKAKQVILPLRND